MRRAPGVIVLLPSALLGIVLLAPGHPGSGQAPDIGRHWAAPAPILTAKITVPLVGKRWS